MTTAYVTVPESVASWVREQAAAMGVPTWAVWLAIVNVTIEAQRADENALVFAVEDAMRKE